VLVHARFDPKILPRRSKLNETESQHRRAEDLTIAEVSNALEKKRAKILNAATGKVKNAMRPKEEMLLCSSKILQQITLRTGTVPQPMVNTVKSTTLMVVMRNSSRWPLASGKT